MVDDASEPPSNKRLKLTEKTNYNNTGFVEEKDLSDHPNYLQAKGVVAQDHVFSHTGFLTSEKVLITEEVEIELPPEEREREREEDEEDEEEEGEKGEEEREREREERERQEREKEYMPRKEIRTIVKGEKELVTMITPGAIATDNLAVINLVARNYDPDVTSEDNPDEINVRAQTLRVRNIAGVDKNNNSAVTIDGDFMVNGEVVGDFKASKVNVTTDLTVGGKATFNSSVAFTNTDTEVEIPNLTVSKHLDIKGTVTGINSTSDMTNTDQIDAKTKGGSIELTSPVRGLEVETYSKKAIWDTEKEVFYRIEKFKDDEGRMIRTTDALRVKQINEFIEYF